MKVLVSIPAFNEEKTIGFVLAEIKREMRKARIPYDVLVLDDGSKDRTVQIARKAGAKVISHHTNLGLAQAFKDEVNYFLKSKYEIIVHTDADGQYPAKYIPEMIKKVKEGNDLVLGSRFRYKTSAISFAKKYGNKLFARAISRLIRQRITDSTSGFRAFTKDVARLDLINRFTYTQEQVIRAARHGYQIAEIPIKPRRTRPSRLFSGALQYALKAWINIFRIYRDFDPLKFFGLAGSLLLFPGLILGAYIVLRIILLGSAGGIPRVMLSALLVLTGLQIIAFGFLADMQRK